MKAQNVIASMSASPNVHVRTTAPYALGKVWIGRIGFASIPVVGCVVYHKQPDRLVAVVRQHVYRALAANGLPYNPETIDTRPLVGYRSRQRVVVDENTFSDSYGKRKRMHEAEYTFEILNPKQFAQCYGQLPDYRGYLN